MRRRKSESQKRREKRQRKNFLDTLATLAMISIVSILGYEPAQYLLQYFGLIGDTVDYQQYIRNEAEIEMVYDEEAEETHDSVEVPCIDDEEVEETLESEIIGTDLLDMNYDFQDIDFEALLAANEDVDGWIHIDDTNVDHAILHGEDNEFYSHHDLYGNYSGSGSIYLDNRNELFENVSMNDLNDLNFIYGHHMTRRRMFSDICNYKNQSFYEEHPFFVMYSSEGYAYKADVFAGIICAGSDTSVYSDNFQFDSEEEFNNYMEYLKENSLISSDLSVEYGDKIVGLVTCSYENGLNGDLRFIVFARLSKQYIEEQGPTLGRK